MTDGRYRIAEFPPGQCGYLIVVAAGDERSEALVLPGGIPPGVPSAVAAALQRAYEDGRRTARDEQQAARPSDAMAERAARLLLTGRGVMPVVHVGVGDPLRPLCGDPGGFGAGGHTTMTLHITCRGCMDAAGTTEDKLAEWERMLREPPPADGMTREQIQEKYGV